MTSSAPGATAPRPETTIVPWTVPVLRAAPAVVAVIVTTFTGGHSAQFGLVVFAGWIGLTAVADVIGSRLLPTGRARTVFLARAVIGALAALIAALAAIGALGQFDDVVRTAVLALTAAATFIVCGMLEAGLGVRSTATDAFGRDWTTAGTIQILAAVVILFVPPGFEHHFQVDDVQGVLTGSIIVVGVLGVTAALLGVLLSIAGFSVRGRLRPADALAGDAGDDGASTPSEVAR